MGRNLWVVNSWASWLSHLLSHVQDHSTKIFFKQLFLLTRARRGGMMEDMNTKKPSKTKPRISIDELAQRLLDARYPDGDVKWAREHPVTRDGWRRVARRAMRLLRP
jgi:hypothetical protein